MDESTFNQTVFQGIGLSETFSHNSFIPDEISYPLKKQWGTKAPKGGFSKTAAFDGAIYSLIGSRKGLVAIDAATGEYLWQELTAYHHDCHGLWAVPPHHLMLMESFRNDLYMHRVDAQTGQPTGHQWNGPYMNVLGLIDGCIAFGGRGDTINFLPIESPDKCEQRQWPNVHGSVHTSVGESSWLSSVFVEDLEGLGVDSAGVINPITGEVLFTTPSGTPRCAGAGYWVVGPELHFARKSSPISVIEEQSGKVVWDLRFHPSPSESDDPQPVGHRLAKMQYMRMAIHPEHRCVVMVLEEYNGYTLDCFDLPTGERRWSVPLEAVMTRSYGPVQWLIITGNIIWMSERLPAGPQDVLDPKSKPTVTARDIHTGQVIWKKTETGLSALVIDNSLILSTGNSMKCYR